VRWHVLDQPELCTLSTAHDRIQTLGETGVSLMRWKVDVEQFDELYRGEWEWLAMDGELTKAPLGGKTGPEPTDRGRSGVNRSLLTGGT
jgi:hypothetical protein